MNKCATCQKPAGHVCAHCFRSLYCSADCQKQHWERGHQEMCVQAISLQYYEINSRGKRELIDDPTLVGIEVRDGTLFKFTIENALKMQLLSNLLYKYGILDNAIRLEYASALTVTIIQNFQENQQLDINNLNPAQIVNLLVNLEYLGYFEMIAHAYTKLCMYYLEEELDANVKYVISNLPFQIFKESLYFFQTLTNLQRFKDRYKRFFKPFPNPLEPKYEAVFVLTDLDDAKEVSYPLITLEKNLKPNTIDLLLSLPPNWTPFANNRVLQVCCMDGYTELLTKLLNLPQDYGIDPSANDNECIILACLESQVKVVEILLALPKERGVDPSARDNICLQQVVLNDNLEIARILLYLPEEYAVDPLADQSVSVLEISSLPMLELFDSLPEERGVDFSVNDNYLLRNSYENYEIVQYLLNLPLERNIDPGANDNELLRRIARIEYAKEKHVDILRLLLSLAIERGVDPSVNDNEPLRVLKNRNLLQVFVEFSLKHDINFDFDNNYMLRKYCETGRSDLVEFLLSLPWQYNIDPSVDNNYCLYAAVEGGYVNVVRALLMLPTSRGVNPFAKRLDEEFAILHKANLKIDKTIFNLLLEEPFKRMIDDDDQFLICNFSDVNNEMWWEMMIFFDKEIGNLHWNFESKEQIDDAITPAVALQHYSIHLTNPLYLDAYLDLLESKRVLWQMIQEKTIWEIKFCN